MSTATGLNEKKILIIGASAGIGRQTAVTLSQLGARLVLSARRMDKLEETKALLTGDGHLCLAADAGEPEQVERLLREAVESCGPLDGMVYTAGITCPLPLNMLKPEKLQEVMRVNFFGYVESVRQFSRKGRYVPGARIVGISSVAAAFGDKTHTAYSASKAAMEGATRCMAVELADKHIAINTVAPGIVETEMFSTFVERRGSGSDSVQKVLERQYLGLAKPESVASAIAFLLSPAADVITGISLPVDGGYSTC